MTADTADALGTEDYAALHAMLLQGDPQGSALAKKLTATEQQAFFDYQKTANKGAGERTREDNSVLGMPPEFAALAGMSIGRAIGQAGLSAAGRAVAGLKASVGQVTPILKYEATKSALEAIGVPAPLATAAGYMVAGYKKGAKAGPAAAEAASGPHLDRSVPMRPGEMTNQQILDRVTQGTGQPPVAVEKPMLNARSASAAPVASAPAPSAPPVPPVVQSSPQSVRGGPSPAAQMGPDGLLVGRPGGNPNLPDQRALNEAALAARRSGAQTPPPSASAASANVKLNAAETRAFLDLMQRGMSGPDAMKSVLLQRELVGKLGSPSAAEVRADMTQRYRSGQKSLAGYDKP